MRIEKLLLFAKIKALSNSLTVEKIAQILKSSEKLTLSEDALKVTRKQAIPDTWDETIKDIDSRTIYLVIFLISEFLDANDYLKIII